MQKYLASIAVFIIAAMAARATETADLRGYGKVSADLTPGGGVFACDSAAKADILLDKLQADLFWDPMFPVKKREVTVGTAKVTVYSLEGYGSAVIARSGKNVVVIAGASEAEAVALAAKAPLLLGADVTSQAVKPHPFYLDYFDNKAFKSYVQPMKSHRGFGIESHWPFLKAIGSCEAFFGPYFSNQSPAPGVIDWTAEDYEVQEAERQNDMVVIKTNGGGQDPLWAANAYPGEMMKGSETTLLGDWGGAAMAGAHYEAWSMPLALRSQLGLGFLEQVMRRYGGSPSVGGWMILGGSPGVEYNFHGRATRSWDTSPAGQEGWRNWLRDQRGWTLEELGTRWYGDASHFSTWKDVTVPDINEFYGALGEESYRLNTGWRWRSADGFAAAPPQAAAPGWVPFAMPPSQQEAFLGRKGVNYFDVTFDASDWLRRMRQGADIRLVFGMIGTGNDAVRAWLNDQPLKIPKDPLSRNSSFALDVTGLLKSGSNHLAVGLNCASFQTCGGKLAGPVFLTNQEPRHIPYLGPQANARYEDFTEWQSWAITEYYRQMLNLARKLDPERPYVLSGGAEPLVDEAIHLATDYGMGIENTGREASYRPHLPGEGMAAGFYPTSEWSDTPKGDKLDQGFGWILIDGDSSHCLYHDVEEFQEREKADGWFTRHKRLIQLFGKYLRVQPEIALLQSAETSRLSAAKGWDIGLGEIEAAHYDNAYVTEEGLKEGLAARYPVLFDTGSEFMEADTVDAIRKYVEQGGTFIALNTTAMETALEPDSHPLAELSGFKVSSTEKSGKIRFGGTLPIFKGWENKEFDGRGMAVDSLKDDHAKSGNLGLTPSDPSAAPLARWDDGSVAVGYRKVGKGRIITLGSTFWRDGKDVSGVWRNSRQLESQFLERLFTDCGISRTANASNPEVWTRKMVTKNGLQNWLMAFNSTRGAVDSDIWMAADGKPDAVIDLETGAGVPFEYENNGVTIKGVHFGPFEVKPFAVRRGTLASGLNVWWGEKTVYWKRTPAEVAAASMTLPKPEGEIGKNVIPLNDWRFHTDEDNAIDAKGQWTLPGFDDSAWQIKQAGNWNLFDPALKDYHGVGLYRIRFTVPASWQGRRILLNLYDFDTPIVHDEGEFSINGTAVATYKAHGWSQTYNYDVTPQTHAGENVLTIKATGGPKLGGLGGSVWIESRAPLAPSLDLRGTWQVVAGDWLTRNDIVIPGSARGKYLTRDVEIPADWSGKRVCLEWATQKQWVGSVVINGRPIGFNGAMHPFGLLSRVNVTPYLLPGQKNVVEIWPFRTVTTSEEAGAEETGGLQLDSISIGCE